jgi:predicted permease
MIRQLLTRLRFLLRPNSRHDLDEEIEFHIEQSIRHKTAQGIPLEEARRQALIEFGGVERTREQSHQQRPGWWLETLAQDIRYALRGFRRNPVFTLTAIATLALGIGATTAVFSVVDPILFRALPYGHPDRLVSIGLTQSLEKQEFTLGGFYYYWKDNQTPFESLTEEGGTDECDLTEHNPVRLNCARVEGNFLPTLGISPLLGRNFLPEEDRPHGPKVALISYGLWLTQYNRDPGILNRLIEIDGKPVRVVGVLPKDFEMPRLQAADIVVPRAVDISAQRTVNDGLGIPMWVFARLKPGVTLDQAREAMQPLYQDILKILPVEDRTVFRKDFHFKVRSLRDRQVDDIRLIAWILFGSVLAVLLIACANVASLLLTRAAARQRELAVRSALGASRSRLIRQTLTEALLLSLSGAAAGCGLAAILLKVFVAIAPAGIPFLDKATLDPRILLFTVLLSLLCGALFGLFPALQRPRTGALAARSTPSGSHAALRRILVVGQIAVSMILLSGAGLLLRSFQNLQSQNLGMQTHGILTVETSLTLQRYASDQKKMEFYRQVEDMTRRIPGVTSVGMSDSLPPAGWHGGRRYADLLVDGRSATPLNTGGTVTCRSVNPGYFRALGIPIVKGQNFTEEQRDLPNEHFMILSRLLADRLFPRQNPLGQRIRIGKDDDFWFTVVGVAADVRNADLQGDNEPEFYTLRRYADSNWNRTILTVVTALPPDTVAPWIRSRISRLDPSVPVDIEPMHERISKLADRPRFESALLGFFAFTGLLMAIIGLYGVTAFMVAQRTQEVGVRMALGASRSSILRLILWDGVRLIAIGTALGLCAALTLSRLLRTMLFSIGPHDPITFVAVTVLLALVALIATLLPASSATKVDPVVALRYE